MIHPKNTILMVILLLSFSISAFSPAHAQKKPYEPIIGIWDVTVDMIGNTNSSVLTITAKNDTLFGTLSIDLGSIQAENVLFLKDTLTLVLTVDLGGQFITLNVFALLKENKLSGSITFAEFGESYPMAAIKRPPKKDGSHNKNIDLLSASTERKHINTDYGLTLLLRFAASG